MRFPRDSIILLIFGSCLIDIVNGIRGGVWTISHVEQPGASTNSELTFEDDLIIPRNKRYVLRKKQWTKNVLLWRLKKKLITDGDEFIVRNTLHRAFNNWASVSSVRFQESSDEHEDVDIEVAFEKGSHADSFPFDGPDGVVAHAFYPRDGRLHFDADEEWTLNQSDGVNLYQTAVHEIGHLLGLEHSTDPRAAMFAAKRPYEVDFQLADDDVRAIRVLFPLKKKITHSLIELPTVRGESEGTREDADTKDADDTDVPFSTRMPLFAVKTVSIGDSSKISAPPIYRSNLWPLFAPTKDSGTTERPKTVKIIWSQTPNRQSQLPLRTTTRKPPMYGSSSPKSAIAKTYSKPVVEYPRGDTTTVPRTRQPILNITTEKSILATVTQSNTVTPRSTIAVVSKPVTTVPPRSSPTTVSTKQSEPDTPPPFKVYKMDWLFSTLWPDFLSNSMQDNEVPFYSSEVTVLPPKSENIRIINQYTTHNPVDQDDSLAVHRLLTKIPDSPGRFDVNKLSIEDSLALRRLRTRPILTTPTPKGPPTTQEDTPIKTERHLVKALSNRRTIYREPIDLSYLELMRPMF